MSVTIHKCTVAELKRDISFPSMFSEYADECAIAMLPSPDEKMAAYDMIERSGVFQAYGAFSDAGVLLGFMALLTPVIPHYGVCIATMESLFVGREYRGSGAGLKLLRAAERHAEAAGCPGLLVSAPTGGQLAEVLARRDGYAETNRVFFRKLDHE
jgi:GNAT superfamily N-acetyltransferase